LRHEGTAVRRRTGRAGAAFKSNFRPLRQSTEVPGGTSRSSERFYSRSVFCNFHTIRHGGMNPRERTASTRQHCAQHAHQQCL